jgi:type 1 fimbriae regulatory protein FimB/type 1 fimbriae regulatory protein FimE
VRRPRDREHLTPQEVDSLIQAARKGRYGLRDSTLLLMLFSHGLRLTEALALRWHHLDLDQGVLHLKRKKNGVSGDHKLRGVEIRALRRLWRGNKHPAGDSIFTSERGTPLSARSVQTMIDHASDRGGTQPPEHPSSFAAALVRLLPGRARCRPSVDPILPGPPRGSAHDAVCAAFTAAVRWLVG